MLRVQNRVDFLNEIKKDLVENPICVEIGVYKGNFSVQLLEQLNPERLFLMDPFTKVTDPISGLDYYPAEVGWEGTHRTIYSDEYCLNETVSKVYNHLYTGKVVIVRDISTQAVTHYPNEFFDFIYIDAVHLYESVLWDMENYYPKLKKGGILAGHDYTQAFTGVMKAVDEFCEKMGLQITVLNEDGGDFALTKKS